MAKFPFEFAAAFAPQIAEGTYNAGLDAITTSLSGDPDAVDEGLLLGDAQSGIAESGLSFGVARGHRDKAFIAGSFTRPLSDFLKLEVPTFTFSWPFSGPKRTTAGSPVDINFRPLLGVDAIFNGAGLDSAAWTGGTGHQWAFDPTTLPFSALIYANQTRLELLDCRTTSLSLVFEPGSIAIATAEIAVGSVKDPANDGFSVAPLPTTLDYGAQATVSSPVVESVAHDWGNTRGFSRLEITITPAQESIPDGNAVDGAVVEATGRETKVNATLFADDADEAYEIRQALATTVGDLASLDFQVGTAAIGADPALAIAVSIPTPELDTATPGVLGSKASSEVSLFARGATANSELTITAL